MRWDLSVLYSGFQDPAFKQDMASLKEHIEKTRRILADGGDALFVLENAVTELSALTEKEEKLLNYTYLVLSVEAENEQAAAALDPLLTLQVDIAQLHYSLSRFLGGIESLEPLMEKSERLRAHGFFLQELKEKSAHLMPKEIESWMLRMSLTGGEAFSQLRDKLEATLTVDLHGEQLPLSAVRAKAYDKDPLMRKSAYEAEQAAYPKVELSVAACLNSIKGEARTMAEARKFDSVLDWTLNESRMDRETLNALWTAVKEALPAFRRYLKAKARFLGHADGLPFHDLMAPVGRSSRTFSLPEAREFLISALGQFSPEMGEFIGKAFDERWLDVEPRPGKQGGAFCASVHSLNISRILSNFAGSFSDVSTLAHELGHAWHARCMEGLPILMTETPMPLAETASIFNETLLNHIVMKTATKEEAFTLLEADLMESTQTVVDIYGRFLFESEVIESRADHSLSVNELKDAMLRAQEASYGDGLSKDVRHPYMWVCKGHYYSPSLHFYNFPYAFGLLFGKGIFSQYLKKGKSFVPTYNKLLRSCGSGTVAQVAASVGIDVRSVDFWRGSLAVIAAEADRFAGLCEEQ